MDSFRRRRGRSAARLTVAERDAIVSATLDVIQLLEPVEGPVLGEDGFVDPGVPDDPAVARLFPEVSKDDPELIVEYRRLTQDDLRVAKYDRLLAFVTILEEAQQARGGQLDVSVDDAQAPIVLGALTDIRIVLADRLGIRTDEDSEALMSEFGHGAGPESALVVMYVMLGWWQETLLTTIPLPGPGMHS